MRITFSKTLLLATTAFSMISVPAANAYLSPLSFNEMYAHASRGNLTVLNNAILRGMNINAVNGDGDTGICVAIRRGDHIAYESFRNTGAHTRPRCLNNINAKQYKKFMADHRPYELAYRKEGSSIWWWIGGAAAVGGIALAAGGGGGGGGSDPLPVPAPEDPTFHSNKGLGYVVATSDPSEPETTPYEPVMISAEDKTTEVNRESMQLSNNAKMWVYNPDTFGYDTLLLSDLIDFDKDINSYTKYIRVGMRAYNDSVVINDTEQTISAGSGTVGLDALLNSSASNLGTIEISAPNGSIGMVASDYSEAGNTGTISMEFTGKDTADSLIGMYADTNSSLTNAGTISGKADTARGRVTGMQTRLTSYYADFVNKAVNSGKIELSGSSDNAGGMSLWGMSSWLDRAFIDGDKSAAKLDKATLTNKGDISLTFSLQPSDEEGAVDPEDPLTLAAGNGGIVGMHADANTTATNNGNITIAVTGDAGETLSAGMQAVRGGSIVNGSGKNITVSAEGSAYGMMAISGSNGGKNFTDVKSAVDNRGSITVTAGDTAYGIYSTVKGDVKNSGKITINGAGYGIFNQNGSVNSSGSIIVAGTGEKGSYGIYAEAEAGSGNKITNAADITMTFAPEEEGGDDEEEQPTLPANYGIYGWNVDIENSGSVSITQQNEKSEDVFGIVSEESSINNSGTVVINGNGSAVYAGGGSLTNSGSITLNGDGYGLIAEDGDLTNSGTVTLNGYGYAVLNDGGNLTNGGEIYLNGSGWGVYAKNGNLINNAGGNVTVNADDLAAISGLTLEGSGYQLQNNARIVLTSTGAKVTKTAKAIDGGDSSVVNSGNITIGSSDVLFTDSYGIYNRGSSLTNSGSITVFGSGYGIYGKGSIDNSGNIAIHAENDVAPVYGIYGQNGSVIDNDGQINIASSKAVNTSAVFGIYGNSAEINNNGSIKIGDGGNLFNAATGIRADNKNVNNSGTVRIYGAGTAISAENGNIVNNSGGGITMVISGAADSYGIYLAGRGSNTLTNNATVKVNRSSAYAEGKKAVALYAENGSINNSGALEVGAKDAVINGGIGIETDGGNVTNGGTITVYGNGSAIKAADGSITNNASATVYGNGSVLNGQNGNVTNNEKGQLNIYTDGKASAYGIYLAGSTGNTITNKASIFINRYGAYAQAASTGNYGIWTDNAKIVNSGDISLGSSTAGLSGIYGLYAAGSGSIENSGVINLYGAGTAIYTASGTVNNTATSGIINIYTDGSADSFGIAAGSSNNGLISNSNKISITAQNGNASAKKNTGIAANNIKNSGTVQIGSSIQAIDKAIGLDGKSIDNDGEILLYGNNAAGIFSDDENADVTNNGRIELNGNGGIGISVTGGNGTVTNTGAITVTSSGRAYGIKNEAGSVENNAVITLNASSSYGILAKDIENSGEIYINKSSGYGLTATDGGSITNYGSITASGSANDGLYGQGSSSFHNEGNITIDGQGSWGLRSSNNVETYNSGRINMSGNKSYGMKIEKGTVENHGDITTADAESFGIWVNNVDSLTNSGTVTVNGADSVGIYTGGSSEATNSGTINVNGDGGKGINTAGSSSFVNNGTININGKNGYGIYAEGTSKVTNSGDIYLNATTATKTSSALYAGGSAVIENSGNLHITASGNGYIWAAYAEGSGSIKNSGTIYVDKATDLIFSGNVTNNGTIEAAAGRMLLNEQVKFGSNARFVADEIAGTASVSADTVKQSNRTQFVLSGNFEGNTDRLNVRSESYLFDAEFDGEKTTLSMKKFAEVENNASIAGFLQNNYGRNNNSDLFDELKSASSQKELTKRISQISGRDVIPTMAEQNLALMKDLHRQFDNAWFNAAPDDKLIAGFNYYDRERGGYGNFAGSDDNAVSLFGIFRNNEGKNVSYGLGWSISKFDSKYDNGGKKDEVIAEILLPFGFGNENFRFLGNMYGGYGNGEYKRYAEGGRFTGDVENYYYGVNNELRGSFDAGFGISLQPTAEFNVAGLYQSGIDDGGLKTGHNNNLSVESGFGLYAEKEFLFNEENSLRLRFGGTWYHEFNDKYQTVKARLDGMEGRFAMDRAEYEKDRGLFSLNGEYRNGGFSFYGETAFEAGRSDNWIFNTGFKYAF